MEIDNSQRGHSEFSELLNSINDMILTMNVSKLNQSTTCICHKLLKMIKKIGIKYLETEN